MGTGKFRPTRFQGKTLEIAIKDAADGFGVHEDEIEYKVVSQTDGGVLSIFGYKKIEIDAWPRGSAGRSRRARSEEETESREPLAELSKQETEKLVEDLKGFCKGICKFLVNEDVDVEAQLEDGRLTLDVNSEALSGQITKNTRLAESMEHLLRKKPHYLKRELPFRIFVDAFGLRAKREIELAEMARDLSLKVAENQRPIVLNYKSSYDRRIIHMALDKNENVYTKSVGSGSNRKLMILPAKAGRGSERETER